MNNNFRYILAALLIFLIILLQPIYLKWLGYDSGPVVSNSISDHVEKKRFEDVWDCADGYVFTHPGSTVFGHTVLTEKPMLLVDLYNNNWNEIGYKLLCLRCNMVGGNFDSDNRIIFDETEFSEKLNNPLPLNDSYVKKFLLGKKDS